MGYLTDFKNHEQLRRIIKKSIEINEFIPHILIHGTQKEARELANAIHNERPFVHFHSYRCSEMNNLDSFEKACAKLSDKTYDIVFFSGVNLMDNQAKKMYDEVLNEFTIIAPVFYENGKQENEKFWVPKFTLIGQVPVNEKSDYVSNLFNVVISIKNKEIFYISIRSHPFHDRKKANQQKVDSSSNIDTTMLKDKNSVYEEAMNELNELIGLDELKGQIYRFAKQMKGEEILRKSGHIKIERPTLHMIFAGSPGTGKTVVARIMAKILYGCGLTDSYHTVETDRSGLIGQYVGQTAPLVMEKVKEALGGVLFIDEAYSLVYSDSGVDYGQEAVDTLMKAAEDHRDNLCIILAGYENKMGRLFERNEGMRSRFPFTFRFYDYSDEELFEIAIKNLSGLGFETSKVKARVKSLIRKNYVAGKINGNARWVRNFTDKIVENIKIRIGEGRYKAVNEIEEEDVLGQRPVRNESELQEIRDQALRQLQEMKIGESTKLELQQYVNYLSIEKKRFEMGVASKEQPNALLFMGPENVGQLESAQIVGTLLMTNQVIENNHVVEVRIEDVVSDFISGNTIILREVIDKARQGVLYLSSKNFTCLIDTYEKQEIFKQILRIIQQNLYEICIIFSIDTTENEINILDEFSELFMNRIEFNPYSGTQTLELILCSLSEMHFSIEEPAIDLLEKFLKKSDDLEQKGDFVQKTINTIKLKQANRLMVNLESDFMLIKEEDVEEAIKQIGVY